MLSPAASGVIAGMTLEEALSRRPDTTVLEADEPTYRRVFQQALTALQGISDRVEGAELGTAYVGLDGLEALHGGEVALMRALREAIPRDLAPRIGVAEAKFPAFVAARTGRRPEAVTVPADADAFLAPRSIDLLPLSRDVREGLLRFGLHTMGAVATMRVELLIDQFGNEGKRAWELCQGIDSSALVPLETEEAVVERIPLPFASTSLELVLTGIDTLLKRAFARPVARGRYASRAELACLLHGAPPWEKAFHFRQGVGSWEGASRTIRRQMEDDHPEAPVEELVLELAGLGEGKGEQMGLFPDVREGREAPPGGGRAAAPGTPRRRSRALPDGAHRALAPGPGDARSASAARPLRAGTPCGRSPCPRPWMSRRGRTGCPWPYAWSGSGGG